MSRASHRVLPADSNQARGIAQYAIEFCQSDRVEIESDVVKRLELFHLDSVACGLSALKAGTNAPVVLRDEARRYAVSNAPGASCFGPVLPVHPEKAIVANSAAVREWDSNGTNFGYNPQRQATRGEFGHNDFYPVAVAAGQVTGADGRKVLRGMLCLDEIRGRLAEVFALKDHKIDHVLHGAIASAAVYGAMLGASIDQIESAIGMTVAHYVPFRAIRAGRQLSDSKGASAAISTEVAVLSMIRSMHGFQGPADVFRNPQAVFCLFEPPGTPSRSPFDLVLAEHGHDFAVMGMHFKLGLYEHQSAGAIQALMNLLAQQPSLIESPRRIQNIKIEIYEPAFSIIGDPAKRDPTTRQSADHSMVYIVATLLRKAIELQRTSWSDLMLLPEDYDQAALSHPLTRQLMQRIDFRHGGDEFDRRYPDGIPTQLEVTTDDQQTFSSGLIMYPIGHARGPQPETEQLLQVKFQRLLAPVTHDPMQAMAQVSHLQAKSAEEVRTLYSFPV